MKEGNQVAQFRTRFRHSVGSPSAEANAKLSSAGPGAKIFAVRPHFSMPASAVRRSRQQRPQACRHF